MILNLFILSLTFIIGAVVVVRMFTVELVVDFALFGAELAGHSFDVAAVVVGIDGRLVVGLSLVLRRKFENFDQPDSLGHNKHTVGASGIVVVVYAFVWVPHFVVLCHKITFLVFVYVASV